MRLRARWIGSAAATAALIAVLLAGVGIYLFATDPWLVVRAIDDRDVASIATAVLGLLGRAVRSVARLLFG